MNYKKIFCLVEKIFEFLFPNLNYEIYSKDKIIIKIRNVNPQPNYNPFNFDASYCFFEIDDKTIVTYTRYDFFYSLYSYIPDYVPNIKIELYPYPLSLNATELNKPCHVFDLIDDYWIYDKKKICIKVPNALNNNIY